MKVIFKEPGKDPKIIEVENNLSTLQKLVGGYIETVTLATDACVVCNEEGRLMGLPYNCTIGNVRFVGPVLIVGVGDEDFCDVPSAPFWLVLLEAAGKRCER